MDQSFFAAIIGCGVVGLVLFTFAEKFVPMFPSSAFLIFVGVTVAADPTHAWLFWLSTTAGSTLGAVAMYSLGRFVDAQRIRRFIQRFGRYALLPTSRYDHLVIAYRRRQFPITLFGQVIPVVRNYLALSAGAAGVTFLPFLAATMIGVTLWNTPFIILGYLLSTWAASSFPQISAEAFFQ
jgi:membrane protein DedA with SNARE-associated domain